MLVFGISAFIFSPYPVKIFRDDPKVIEAGTVILQFQCFTFILQGVIVVTNMLLQNMGCTLKASFLAISRQGLFFIPLVFLLSHFFGLFGLDMTQAIADLCSFFVTVPMMYSAISELKKLNNK